MKNMLSEQTWADLHRRLVEIETRCAFQEDTLHALNAQLAHQQTLIEQQQRMLQAVYQQTQDLRDAQASDTNTQSGQEKPPHY